MFKCLYSGITSTSSWRFSKSSQHLSVRMYCMEVVKGNLQFQWICWHILHQILIISSRDEKRCFLTIRDSTDHQFIDINKFIVGYDCDSCWLKFLSILHRCAKFLKICFYNFQSLYLRCLYLRWNILYKLRQNKYWFPIINEKKSPFLKRKY